MLRVVNLLWIGERLGAIEQLSLASWLASGHPVRLHAYDRIANVPDSVQISDANLIVPFDEMRTLRHRKSGSFALASDYFRYRLQLAGGGLWSDLDVVCLKPVELQGRAIFGLENWDFINGAVLYLDPDLPLASELVAIFSRSFVPPWIRRKKRIEWRFRRMIGQAPTPARLPWGTFGPRAITALAKEHGHFWDAQPSFVFYPIHAREAHYMYDPRFSLESRITERTLTVHLWNEALRDLKSTTPPAGSALAALNRRFGIS